MQHHHQTGSGDLATATKQQYPPPNFHNTNVATERPSSHISTPSSSGQAHHHPTANPSSAGPSPSGAGGLKIPSGVVQVQVPRLEPQPWVLNAFRWLATHTTGVARIDLRRPTPPFPEQYQGNVLFARRVDLDPSKGRVSWRNPRGRIQQDQFIVQQRGNPIPYSVAAAPPDEQRDPTGARVKITRNLHLWKAPGGKGKPLLDLGLGFNLDLDRQRLEPVARIKVKDWVSIKAVPLGLVKLSKQVRIPLSNMALKLLYEVPLTHITQFWMPPARLMVRLESGSGSGMHLSPSGLELDERLLRLGQRLELRGSATLAFPRALPIDPRRDRLAFKVNRLTLKTLW